MTAAHSDRTARTSQPEALWRRPDPGAFSSARLTRFQEWAARHHGAPEPDPSDPVASYAALHRWSTEHLTTFWGAFAEWSGVRFSTPYETVLADAAMPGADWFPGATLNYAEHALRPAEDPGAPPGRRCCTSTKHTSPLR